MIESQAILLRIHRLSETSLIVKWLTAEHGIITSIAKGALRPKSPFSGKLDLFFSGEIQVIRPKKGDLHILKELTISQWRLGLRKKYLTTCLAAYFCQLVDYSLEPMHSEYEIYDLLTRGLDHLDQKEPSLKALFHFERELANALGIGNKNTPDQSLAEYFGHALWEREQLILTLTQEREDFS